MEETRRKVNQEAPIMLRTSAQEEELGLSNTSIPVEGHEWSYFQTSTPKSDWLESEENDHISDIEFLEFSDGLNNYSLIESTKSVRKIEDHVGNTDEIIKTQSENQAMESYDGNEINPITGPIKNSQIKNRQKLNENRSKRTRRNRHQNIVKKPLTKQNKKIVSYTSKSIERSPVVTRAVSKQNATLRAAISQTFAESKIYRQTKSSIKENMGMLKEEYESPRIESRVVLGKMTVKIPELKEPLPSRRATRSMSKIIEKWNESMNLF